MTGRDARPATPTVRVVIVTWNGAHLLRPCLDSVLAQDLPDEALDIVVVDNASTDGTIQMLSTEYPAVEVRITERNLGFAGGVNVGLLDLHQDYAVLLNNDATFEPDAIRHMIEHLADPAHARVAAATAMILLAQQVAGGQVLVNSTGNVLTAGGAADRDWLMPAEGLVSAPEVFGFCGGAAALRKTALDQVGLFDGSLFLYYEDTDLSWRLRAEGWTIHYVATAVAHHRHAATSDSSSGAFRYYNTRNSLIVYGRHAPLAAVLTSALRQVVGALMHTMRRDEATQVLRARWRALRDVAARLPTTLCERHRLWSGHQPRRRSIYRAALSGD